MEHRADRLRYRVWDRGAPDSEPYRANQFELHIDSRMTKVMTGQHLKCANSIRIQTLKVTFKKLFHETDQ